MPEDRRALYTDAAHKQISRRTIIKGISTVALAGISITGCNAQEEQSTRSSSTSSAPLQPRQRSSTATSYAMFRGNPYHSGLNTTEHFISTANVSQLELAWTFPAQDSIDSSPAIANSIVYFGSDDGNLYAVDAKTGEQRWSYTTED